MEDLLSADGPVVLLRGGPFLDRWLLFRDPVYDCTEAEFGRWSSYEAISCVAEVRDRHDAGLGADVYSDLHARISVRTNKAIALPGKAGDAGDDGLAEFLRGLYEDFRGWSGSRHWRNFQLGIEATHDLRGHVTLLFRLRDDLYHRGEGWDLSIPFTVEAGAEMLALADSFEVFFAAAAFRPGGPG